MEIKTLMRAVRLSFSEASYKRSGRPIDSKLVDEIAEAKALLARMRGDEVLAGVVAVISSSLPLEISLSPATRRVNNGKEELPPGRSGRFANSSLRTRES